MDRRRRLAKEALEKGKRDGFHAQVEHWKAQMREMEDARRLRLEQEEQARSRALQERAKEKADANAIRHEMREAAAMKAKAEQDAAEREARRLVAERRKEEEERARFRLEEARQCVMDRFWGILTEEAYERKVEAFRRKMWLARMADKNLRMVQVGNTDAESKKETALIRAQHGP